jgi:hypothetical protein
LRQGHCYQVAGPAQQVCLLPVGRQCRHAAAGRPGDSALYGRRHGKPSIFATSSSTSTSAGGSCIKRNRGPLVASSASSVRRSGSNFFKGRSRGGRLYLCAQSWNTKSAQEFCAAILSSGGAISTLWMRSACTCAIH